MNSPIVPAPYATIRVEPDTATPSIVASSGIINPVAWPDVVSYPTTSPLGAAKNRLPPETAKLLAEPSPEISEAFTVAPEVVYSPTEPRPKRSRGKRSDPEIAMPTMPELGSMFGSGMSDAFIVAPVREYSPIPPPLILPTKI